eukprot:621326-Amphidinium_carterae.4
MFNSCRTYSFRQLPQKERLESEDNGEDVEFGATVSLRYFSSENTDGGQDSDEPIGEAEVKDFDFEKATTWQKALFAVKDPYISQASLHRSHLSDVLVEILTNLLAVAAFAVWLVVLDLHAVLLLGLFCIFSMLVVTAVEVARAQGIAQVAFFGLVVGPLPRLLVCHASKSSKLVMMLMWIFAVSAVWLALSAIICGKLHTIYRSALYQACSGLVRVPIRSRTDIAMLAKGIRYVDHAFDHGKHCGHNLTHKLTTLTSIGVGTVQTDPDPRVPNVKLTIDGIVFDKGDFVLMEVTDTQPDAAPEPLDLACLEATLKSEKKIADKVISTWFAERPRKAKETRDQRKVREWFMEHEPVYYPLMATFKSINRREAIYSHSGIRALCSLCVACLAGLPMFRIVKDTQVMLGDLCKTPVPAEIFLPDGSPLCGATNIASCATACSTTVNFFEAVNAALHTSYVEILFIGVLVPVILFTLAAQYVAHTHKKLEKEYFGRIRASNVARAE